MTQVKYFHAEQVGAPTLTGVQGTLISVLDACLVDGFGLKSVDSLVVAGNVATVTVSTGHSMHPGMVALISGATPSGLNGEKRVISTTTNTFTFATTGISDQTATGTITTKVAPLGWDKVFSTTNVAVYRPSSVESTRMFLRVDETADGREARVRAYENMTDASTGTGPFPTTDQQANGLFWPKADDTTASQRDWTVVGDHRTLYVHLNTLSSAASPTNFRMSGSVWGFGDFKSFKSGDSYNAILLGTVSGQFTSGSAQGGAFEHSRTDTDVSSPGYIPRNYTGVSGAMAAFKRGESLIVGNGVTSGNNTDFTYPNGPDAGLLLARTIFGYSINSNPHLIGRSRGAYRNPQQSHTSFSQRQLFDGTGELAGRKILTVKCGSPRSGSSQGALFFDVTGPWEV